MLYATTIFCGAFLLFLVQPLMGKYLLPWFGGGPGVWTTCLLFFQTLLLDQPVMRPDAQEATDAAGPAILWTDESRQRVQRDGVGPRDAARLLDGSYPLWGEDQ